MNVKLLISSLFILAASLVSAEDLTLSLDGKGEKGRLPSGLNVIVSANKESVIIHLTDGKQKFGSQNIVFKKGDVTYTRPRLKLSVPMESVKQVKSNKPYDVVEFAHKGEPYSIQLVGSGKLPDVVISPK